MDLLKQVSGIDVSQKELVVTLAELKADLTKEFKGYKVFYNTEKGMNLLLKWVDQNTQGNLPVHYVMEATGVYHERFAYFLESKRQTHKYSST
jgi:transposase